MNDKLVYVQMEYYFYKLMVIKPHVPNLDRG